MKLKIDKNWKFPETRFVKIKTEKKQIVIHISNTLPAKEEDADLWRENTETFAFHYIISRDGRLHKCFDDDYFTQGKNSNGDENVFDAHKINVALENYGPLVKYKDGKYYPFQLVSNGDVEVSSVPDDDVHSFVACAESYYRGFKCYEKYTAPQLETLRNLLVFLQNKHSIPCNFTSKVWFNISENGATEGRQGIFPYSAFVSHLFVPFPDRNFTKLLKSLK